MPALPPVPQVLRVRIAGVYGTSTWMNILHLKYSGNAPLVGDLNSVCQQVLAAWSANIASMCNPAVSTTFADATDLTSSTSAQGIFDEVINGSRSGAAFPSNVAAVVSWHVASRWRGGHGRMYLPAGSVTDVFQNHEWLNTTLTEWRPKVQAFSNALNGINIAGSGFTHGIVRYHGTGVVPGTPLFFPVLTTAIHARVDSQRRRLGKELP